jgi:hypothetical protein
MTDPRTPVFEAKRIAALWAGLLLAPAAFGANLQLGYLLVHPACLRDSATALYVVHILSLIMALTGALIAWRIRQQAGSGFPEEAGDQEGRTRFMAGLGVWTSALFALAIAAQTVPSLMLHPCQ